MKKVIMLFMSIAFILVLSACTEQVGYKYDFAQDRKDPTTIKIWVDDTDGLMIQEMIEEFNKIYPDIIVEFNHMGSVDAMNQLQLSGPSGNGADIFQFPHDQLATALKHELLYAMPDDFVSKLDERMSDISMSIATACFSFDNTVDNRFECTGDNERVFAAPISVESVALFYNKDLLEELSQNEEYKDVFKSAEPVETFEELFAQAAVYNDIEAGKFLFNTSWNDSYFVNFLLSAFGYIPFGEDMSDADNIGLNSDEVKNALTYLQDKMVPMYGVGSTAVSMHTNAHTDFENGKTPYLITGPWMIETYKKLDFEIGVTSIPTINIDGNEVETKPFMGAQMLGVYQHSQHKDAALKFIEFWTSDKGLEIQYKYKGKLPALKEELMDNIAGVKDDVFLTGIRKQLINTIPMPTIPEVEHYWEPVRIMINDAWNDMDPSEAALKAENSYEASRNLSN